MMQLDLPQIFIDVTWSYRKKKAHGSDKLIYLYKSSSYSYHFISWQLSCFFFPFLLQLACLLLKFDLQFVYGF